MKELGLAAGMYTQDFDEEYMEVYRNVFGTVDTSVWPANTGVIQPGTNIPYGWWTSASASPAVMAAIGFTQNWASIPMPYVKSEPMFHCPDGDGTWCPGTSTDSISYVYTNWIGDTGIDDHPAAKLGSIPQAANTILFFETGKACTPVEYAGWNNNPGCTPQPAPIPNPTNTPPENSPDWLARHTNGRNYTFCDGHVKWMADTNASIWINPLIWIYSCQT